MTTAPKSTSKDILIIIAVAALLRIGLLVFFWDKHLTIVDETHYQGIAENILKHSGFSLIKGQPTSFRPPLYPAFLSTIYFLTGGVNYNAVRVTQIILSLGIVFMVYLLGTRLFDRKTGIVAALFFAVYPSFVFFTHFLLTEILFTFFFLLYVWFFFSFLRAHCNQNESAFGYEADYSKHSLVKSDLSILSAGIFLGLASLTRSILYLFLPVCFVFLLLFCRQSFFRNVKAIIFLGLGFAIIVGPWTLRNYLLYKQIVVIGTGSGLSFYHGNYEHTPLNRAWAAVDLTGEKAWDYGHEETLSKMNDAQKQKWAVDRAKDFILDNKLLTLKRSLIKAANFWGLERAVVGPILAGHWPSLNRPFLIVVITLAVFSAYALLVTSGVFGMFFHLSTRRPEILLIFLLIIYMTGIHSLVFGHSRYHLPLVPLLAVFGSWAIINWKAIVKDHGTWKFRLSVVTVILFIGIWVREVLFVEGARYLQNAL